MPPRPQSQELRSAAEPQMLEQLLDWYRDGVLAKVEGLSDEDAWASPVASGTSIAGLVRHLAVDEEAWFAQRVGGLPPTPPWDDAPWDAEPDWEWRTAREEPLAASVALYRSAIARGRQAAAGVSLDEVRVNDQGRPFTVRYAWLHMIEETARHLGHLDVLRELRDGVTGD